LCNCHLTPYLLAVYSNFETFIGFFGYIKPHVRLEGMFRHKHVPM
jgi:hypothetical protein